MLDSVIELVIPYRYQDRVGMACGGSRGKSPKSARRSYSFFGGANDYENGTSRHEKDTSELLDDGRWCSLKSWSLLLSRACLVTAILPVILAQLNYALNQVTPAVVYFLAFQGGLLLLGMCATVFGLVVICVSNTARRYTKRVWALPLAIGLISISIPFLWSFLQPKPAGAWRPDHPPPGPWASRQLALVSTPRAAPTAPRAPTPHRGW